MKIIYLSSVKFPTDKAYGITIKYTVQALVDLKHTVSIFDFNKLTSRQDNKHMTGLITKTLNFTQKILSGFPRLKFKFTQMILVVAFMSRGIRGTDLIWTREPIFAFVLSFFGRANCFVVEIHNVFGRLDKFLLRLTQLRSRLILAPISPFLYKEMISSKFHFKEGLIVMCPMGVPDFFYSQQSKYMSRKKWYPYQLTYSGSLKSIGVSNGVKDLINALASICEDPRLDHLVLTLVGIENEEIPRLKSTYSELIESKKLFVYPRVSHEQLLLFLQEADMLVIPYPHNKAFQGRFPIKAMEYAAVAKPILCTDTPNHRDIFSPDEVWFYQPGDVDSLNAAIREIQINPARVRVKVINAFAKSLTYTYKSRVSQVMDLV